MRLRRLRNGPLALSRLRQAPERPLPGPAEPRCGVEGCRIPGEHRHLPLSHRPLLAANAWPDDALTLTYAELRRLVALHLDLARQGMPNTSPWAWVAERARAVRDGEVPLLVAEVLDPDYPAPPASGPPGSVQP